MRLLFVAVLVLACLSLSAQQNCRLELNNIETISDKGDIILLKIDLINTGQTDIVLNAEANCSVEFVEALSPKLAAYKMNIERALLQERLILSAGKTKCWTLKVSKSEHLQVTKKSPAPSYVVNLENCPDLLLVDYKIVKKTSSYLWIEFTLVNRGKKVANL